jgi:hypothetical protein
LPSSGQFQGRRTVSADLVHVGAGDTEHGHCGSFVALDGMHQCGASRRVGRVDVGACLEQYVQGGVVSTAGSQNDDRGGIRTLLVGRCCIKPSQLIYAANLSAVALAAGSFRRLMHLLA